MKRMHSVRRSRTSPWMISLAVACSLSLAVGTPLEIALTAEIDIDVDSDHGAPPPAATSLPLPEIHEVTVGQHGGSIFDPPFVEANVGELVRFSFLGGNHTVAESTFMSPCSPRGTFDTTYADTSSDGDGDLTIMVDTDSPRWFFCQQGQPSSQCERGMVFAINPGEYWDRYQSRASNSSSADRAASTGLPSHYPFGSWSYHPQTGLMPTAASWHSTTTSQSQPVTGTSSPSLLSTPSVAGNDPEWLTRTFTTTFLIGG